MSAGCTFLALVLLAMSFQITSRKQIRDESLSESSVTLERMQDEIGDYIHELTVKMQTFYTETALVNNMRNRLVGGGNYRDFYWTARNFATNRFDSSDGLRALYIYDCNDDIVSNYRMNVVAYPRDLYDADMDVNTLSLIRYLSSEDTDMLISGYYNETAGEDVIRIVMRLHTYDDKRTQYGYLICDFAVNELNSIMSKYSSSDELVTWIQPTGDISLHVVGDNSGASDVYDELSDVIRLSSSYDDFAFNEEYGNFYLSMSRSQDYDFCVYRLTPQVLVMATQRTLVRTLVLIALVMGVITVFLSLRISNHIFKPLEEMRDRVIRIRSGETDLRMEPQGWSEELELLGTEFNELLDQIDSMMKDKYQSEMLIERTEYQALQAQINPHFLYNTLDTMSSIANAQKCVLVSGLCQSLSAIFRYSLDISDSLSTVQKELAHVRNYLYVMDVRNGSDTGCVFEVDEDTMEDAIPRITLQPIVENAINHGLRNVRRKDKKIRISAHHVGDNLVVEIEDNGIGMDADEFNEALERNDLHRIESGKSIGILNVNARLKKAFGDGYGVRVESVPGEGTVVILTLPAGKGGNEGVD